MNFKSLLKLMWMIEYKLKQHVWNYELVLSLLFLGILYRLPYLFYFGLKYFVWKKKHSLQNGVCSKNRILYVLIDTSKRSKIFNSFWRILKCSTDEIPQNNMKFLSAQMFIICYEWIQLWHRSPNIFVMNSRNSSKMHRKSNVFRFVHHRPMFWIKMTLIK